MNINTWKSIRNAAAVILSVLFSISAAALFPPAAAADGETGSIAVLKTWEGEGEIPQSVTLYLKNGGDILGKLSLSAADAVTDGSWQGRFENVPLYDSDGNAIQYSISEDPVEGWEMSIVRLPLAERLSVREFAEKVTPASEASYSIGAYNLLTANKGGSYYVWTRATLNTPQKERLLSEINAAGLGGFGRELSLDNTEFASGLPTQFEKGVSLRQEGSAVWVDFERTNVWSLFYAGKLELLEAREGLIVNRATAVEVTPSPAPTTSPAPTASPAPSASPAPTPLPEVPETGDTGVVGYAVALVFSLAAAGLILFRLKRF